jgi:signal transduction histidine kinase
MTALALLNNLFLRSISESLWRTFTYLLVTGLCLYLYDISVRKSHNLYSNSIFLFSIGIVPILLSEFASGLLGFQNNYFAAFLIIPIPPVVIIILSFLDLTQRDQDSLISLLEENGDSIFEDLAPGVDLNQRQIASYLHNSFQSELLALSRQLATAALSKDKKATSSVLQRASSVANRSLSENLDRINEQPLDHLTQLIKSWENILSIKIEIPEETLKEKFNTVIFVQTVEEIASNAFRHDKATELRVNCSKGQLGTRLLFQSNGSQPISKSRGMGDSWLNQISLTPWSIEKNDSGTLIVLEL